MIHLYFPKPANWQDFQRFIKDILNEKYQAEFDIFGSEGQAQQGVDILGNVRGKRVGVQCKRVEKLQPSLIEKEIAKATTFTPKLDTYIIATTSARDTKVQTKLAELENSSNLPFNVLIWFWDTVEDCINGNTEIAKRYFKHIWENLPHESRDKLILCHIHGAFSRPAFAAPLKYEENIKDFRQAIKDTHEFMNVGKRRSRDNQYIAGNFLYQALSNKKDVQSGDDVCKLLQDIRNILVKAEKNGKIQYRPNGESYIADEYVAKELDDIRRRILTLLNEVFKRNHHKGLEIPY